MARKQQGPRTPVREIARVLNNMQLAIRASGTVGVRQTQLIADFADKNGISRGVVDREIIRLLASGVVRNDSGMNRNRVLVWNQLDKLPVAGIASIREDVLKEVAKQAAVPLEMKITVLKDPPALAFTLNGVRITVEVP